MLFISQSIPAMKVLK